MLFFLTVRAVRRTPVRRTCTGTFLGRIAVACCVRRCGLLLYDRVARSVCLSVTLVTSEPCKNGRTDQDAVLVVGSGGPK